jgi:hypothetical protein
MRKVTQDVCNAFIAGNARAAGNSHTDGEGLYLHGNCIARKIQNRIVATLAGWPTVTTRERLNGLCRLLGVNYSFSQCRFEQFFGRFPIMANNWVLIPQNGEDIVVFSDWDEVVDAVG